MQPSEADAKINLILWMWKLRQREVTDSQRHTESRVSWPCLINPGDQSPGKPSLGNTVQGQVQASSDDPSALPFLTLVPHSHVPALEFLKSRIWTFSKGSKFPSTSLQQKQSLTMGLYPQKRSRLQRKSGLLYPGVLASHGCYNKLPQT